MNGTAIQYKIPARSKQKEWAESILKNSSNVLSLYVSRYIRETVENGVINLDLYNGKVHPSDMTDFLNPLALSTLNSSRKIQHYPTAAPIIDLLVGEEINRNFEPRVEVTNNIAIDQKNQRIRAYVQSRVDRIMQDAEGDQAIMEREVKKLQRHLRYTYKDIVEKKASALLADYSKKQDFKSIFVEGYRRVFNIGEEVYEIDIVNGEPCLRVVNSLKLRCYGNTSSNRIEDRDIIMVEDHFSPGYLIDRYGDKLTATEIDDILNYNTGGLGSTAYFDKPYGDVTHEFVENPRTSQVVGSILGNEYNTSLIDANGGIRHQRTRWKGYKQVKRILYQDPATGEQQMKVRPNNYQLKEGEALKDRVWIVEWWIGTLIGANIVVDVHPIPIAYNRISSLMESHPGIVGQVYNINERKVVPAMTKMKPYQYWYDVIIDNMIVAMSKHIGPILEMDLAKRPKNWDTKKWLHYITKYNVKFIDSFKEVSKGPAQGQLAGNLASGRDQVQELSFGNYIQQLVSLAEYLDTAMANIIGITPQRLGAVSNRETVGGVERATSQSSHITEWYSYMHETVKLRVLNVFVEAAKTALKDNPKKLQTIIDSTTREILEVTEEDFVNCDLGIYVTDSKTVKEHETFMKQAAQAYMQNGGDFSFIFNVMFSESMAEKRRLLEENSETQRQQADQARQQEMQTIQAQAQAEAEDKQKERDLEKYKADLKAAVDIKLKEIDVLIAQGKYQVEEKKSLGQIQKDIMQMQQTMSIENRKSNIEEKKVQQMAKKPQTA